MHIILDTYLRTTVCYPFYGLHNVDFRELYVLFVSILFVAFRNYDYVINNLHTELTKVFGYKVTVFNWPEGRKAQWKMFQSRLDWKICIKHRMLEILFVFMLFLKFKFSFLFLGEMFQTSYEEYVTPLSIRSGMEYRKTPTVWPSAS